MNTKKIIIISGATASGKSSLALNLLNNNNYLKNNYNELFTLLKKNNFISKTTKKFEIISSDSRQVYKNIPIFSGISKEEEKTVKLINFLNEEENFSAGDFEKKATIEMEKIWNKNKIPVIVGGTSFYLQSLLFKNFLPQVDINTKLRKSLEKKSINDLLKILKKLDSDRLSTIDKKNRPRIIRAIEIATKLGKVPKTLLEIKDNYKIVFVWVKINIEKQKKLIEKNFIKRINNGFLEEALKLKTYFKKLNWTDEKIEKRFYKLGLAYKFIFNFWDNKISKKEFILLGIKEEQKYAKRQNTYLKKFFNILPKEIIKIEIEKK